ncbi:MAG TPA: ARMT1-like domain-containing protein, partial [Candidatus Sabulitectum sp.]|nr:ARMT1-like domain-containing protein [Candidatus Sabulitectum sp.]
LCSREFMELFDSSPLIISKGQGNYEGLSGTRRPVFFLLKAKCPVIAGDMGVSEGDLVLEYSLRGKER